MCSADTRPGRPSPTAQVGSRCSFLFRCYRMSESGAMCISMYCEMISPGMANALSLHGIDTFWDHGTVTVGSVGCSTDTREPACMQSRQGDRIVQQVVTALQISVVHTTIDSAADKLVVRCRAGAVAPGGQHRAAGGECLAAVHRRGAGGLAGILGHLHPRRRHDIWLKTCPVVESSEIVPSHVPLHTDHVRHKIEGRMSSPAGLCLRTSIAHS